MSDEQKQPDERAAEWVTELRRAHVYLDQGKPFFSGKDCTELADLLEMLAARATAPQASVKGDDRVLLNAWYEASATGKIQVSDEAYRIVTETAVLLERAAAPQATITKLAESNTNLRAQIERYQAICASAYQLAGAVDAPLRFLDALASAANGEPVSEEAALDLLPVTVEECAVVPQAGTTLTDGQVDTIMEQAQVFASAWSLVGGVFDSGNALETAEQEKANLRALLTAHPTERAGK